jgi:hypothetical protein
MRARAGLAAVVLATGACGASNFDPPSLVESVRILATQADLPYAQPGERVTLQMLAVDGRADRSRPMRTYWLPQVCQNPAHDLYYTCYGAFGRQFVAGVDIGPQLVAGSSLSFTMPADAIAARAGGLGGTGAYGVVYAFAIACAGHVEYVATDPSSQSPATNPFGCFDDAHHALGADDFVFAFARVYAFTDRRNANPVIDHLTFGGAAVDPAGGITVAHCTASSESNCPTTDLDTVVPDSSQEPAPGDVDANGNIAKEALWVDYYLTAGRVKTDSPLLFDAHSGRVPSTADPFDAPLSMGEQTLWAVVHDDRGGTSWVTVPLHAQ